MPKIHFVYWDDPDDPDGNTAHVAQHGLTPDEVDSVLLDPRIPGDINPRSGNPEARGTTNTGRAIRVIFEAIGDDAAYPLTAFETQE